VTVRRVLRHGTTAALAALALALPGFARADSANDCTAAAESAQTLRNAGKLVQAQAQLRTCMKTCPRLVQNDCGQWLHDVEMRIASVVVRATDARGTDVLNVRVTMDGALLMHRLEGLAAPVDPGVHRFVFEREGSVTVTQDVTIREGEKARTISVSLPDPPKAKQVEQPVREVRPLFPTSSLVLGGLGVVGLGTFVVYHLSAKSDLDAMRTECAPRCPADGVDTLDQKILVSNIALGVGATALTGAILVFLFEGGWHSTKTTAPASGRAKAPFVVSF